MPGPAQTSAIRPSNAVHVSTGFSHGGQASPAGVSPLPWEVGAPAEDRLLLLPLHRQVSAQGGAGPGPQE